MSEPTDPPDEDPTDEIRDGSGGEIERPATWENVVMGKAKEALGHLVRDKRLIEQGEEQEESAHDVREEFTEQRDEE